MSKRKKKIKNKNTSSKMLDSGAKLLFGNNELCAQFLRNYSGFELFKGVKAEDIEDVSERFVHLFTAERRSDVVKLIHLNPDNTIINDTDEDRNIFVIVLIDHKSGVDYNVSMQLLRYMVYIWERCEKKSNIHRRKYFKYPLILPIVFYEGYRSWTSDMSFKDRIAFGDIFSDYLPDYRYKLIRLNDSDPEKILMYNDELSAMLALMQLMGLEDIEILRNKKDQITRLFKNSSYEIKGIMSQLIEYIMRRMEFSEEEIIDISNSVEDEKMDKLFEHEYVPNNMRILREKSAKYDAIVLDFNEAKEKLKAAEEKILSERTSSVLAMLSDGVPHNKIALYTGMTMEEIKALADELQ